MRILHVIGSLNPKMGGLPKAALSLACAQAIQGGEVGILYDSDADQEEWITTHFLHLPGLDRVQRLPVLSPDRWEWWTRKQSMASLRSFQPGVIHVHGIWEPLLLRTLQQRRIPAVLTPHSMLHPWQNRNKRLMKMLVKGPMGWRKAWSRAAWVQALSEQEAAHLRKQGFEKIHVIPNGVFPEEDLEPSGEWLHGLDGGPFLLFLGRLHAVKGADLLLEAFARISAEHPDLYLVLAGPDGGQRDQLLSRSLELDLKSRVIFPGLLRGRELWSALHQTACFCLPSASEGCSVAVLEAGLAGAPLALSEACDLPSWFEDGVARVLPPEVEGMAEVLRDLLARPGQVWTLGRHARAKVLTEHNLHLIARKILTMYPGRRF